MIALIPFVLLLPYFEGMGWMRLRKEKERISPGQCYLMGFLTILLLAQIASFISIKADFTFEAYTKLLSVLMVAGAIVSTATGFREGVYALKSDDTVLAGFRHLIKGRRMDSERRFSTLDRMGKKELLRIRVEIIVIIAVLMIQCLAYFVYVPATDGSTMAETILVTNATNTIFKYNPVTGGLLERGIYPIFKLSSLPIFYSALYKFSGLTFDLFLYVTIPVWTTCVSMAVMVLWGEVLSRGMKERRVLILMFYSVLLLMRSGVEGTYAHMVVHEGFKGTGLFAAILVPLFLCGIYLIIVQNEKLYGGIMSLLCVNAALMAVPLIPPTDLKDFFAQGNTEWCALFLAIVVMLLMWDRSGIRWKKTDIAFLGVVMVCSFIPGSVLAYVGLSYCLTRICDMARQWGKRRGVYIGSILLICLYGTVLPMRSPQIMNSEVPENEIMVQEAVQGCISELKEKDPDREVILAAPDEVMERSRLHGINTRLIYGKDMWYRDCNREVADIYPDEYKELYKLMKYDYMDPDAAAKAAFDETVDVLVLREHIDEATMEEYGCAEPLDIPGYAIYVRNR